jgi:hypothetical protein
MTPVTLEQVMHSWAKMIDPKIVPTLYKHKKVWTIRLDEIWPEGQEQIRSTDSLLDKRVAWTYQELKKWADAKRTAWDMWVFDDKRSAEKFITLYYLVWAK